MPQTLLSILALMVLMFFSLQQNRHQVQHERAMTSVEMEIMGNAVASEMLKRLESVPFDRRIGAVDNLSALHTSDLTRYQDFPDGKMCDTDNCEDGLEEFNRMRPGSETFTVTAPDGTERNFEFAIDAEVFYVDDDGRSSNRTMTKRVRIEVQNEYLRDPLVMEKDFSPQ